MGDKIKVSSGDLLLGFVITLKDDDASPNFYGYQRADGHWYILKETLSPGNDTYQYAKGTENLQANWLLRTTTLTYKDYADLFS